MWRNTLTAVRSCVQRGDNSSFRFGICPTPQRRLETQLTDALELLIAEEPSGDVLAFLPGAAEIRRAMRESQGVARRAGLLVLPLHGDLSPAEQDRAITPAQQRKVILATNVAESSITVEGVTAVIDSGLARIATYSQWTGLPTLQVGRVSKASAKQRAGRAGRTGPGRVLRLYAMEDYLRRPEHDAPEIARSDLSQLCLALRAMRIGDQSNGWMHRRRQQWKVPRRCLIVWAPQKQRGPAIGAVSAASAAVAHSHRGHGARSGRGRLHGRSAAGIGRSLGEK